MHLQVVWVTPKYNIEKNQILLIFVQKPKWKNVVISLVMYLEEHPAATCKFLKLTNRLTLRAGNLLFAHHSFAHFAQIKWATVSNLLISLKTNERLWANHSGRSRQMSNREQITQVAYDKWSTVSDWLRSLMINEQISYSLKTFCLKKSKI